MPVRLDGALVIAGPRTAAIEVARLLLPNLLFKALIGGDIPKNPIGSLAL